MVRPTRLTIIPPASRILVKTPEDLLDLPATASIKALENLIGSANDIEKCQTFLAEYGLIPNRRECPTHFEPMTLVKSGATKDGIVWRCPICKKDGFSGTTGIRSGSNFDRDKLPLPICIRIAHYWSHHPKDSHQHCANELEISRETVGIYYQKFRSLCEQWFASTVGNEQLGGPGKVVEIDESKFCKAKYGRGRMLQEHARDPWVFGLMERGTDRMAFFTVEKRDAKTLIPLIKKVVAPGTTIMSDCWKAYSGLREHFEHQTVNHKRYFVDPETNAHTQSIEATWGAMKHSLKHLRGVPQESLPSDMFEYCFRRFHQEFVFESLLFELSFV